MRGYPDSVSEPGPKSVPTNTVSWSSHDRPDLASGNWKPSATNSSFSMSNSRTTVASAPPRDSSINATVYSGSMTSAPAQTQFSSSVSAKASTSMMTSHSGSSVR